MKKLTIGYRRINGVHMFCSEPYHSEEQKRIYGYKDSKRQGVALYPGFLPAAKHTLADLDIVFGDALEWTPDALARKEYIKKAINATENVLLPVPDDKFVLPLFEHQKEVVVKAFWEERVAIFHDCGLGKTKSMIDVFRLLKEHGEDFKALVLCPSHLVRNWKREIAKHTFEGELSTCVLVDENNAPLCPAAREEVYTGTRQVNPDPAWRYTAKYPDLFYESLPDGLPEEVYTHEEEYVKAIVNDDATARTRARAALRRRAKKYGFTLPKGSWRMLGPAPAPASAADVLIVSYDIAATDLDLIKKHFSFNVIAADESHYLRTYNSARTKAARKLAARAERRYLMSGTPSLGDPMHVYGQLQFLSPVFTGNWFKYTRRYLVKSRYNDKMTVGYKNLHILNDILSDVAHRKKQEECLDLPPLRFVDIDVDVGPETRTAYNDLVSTWSTQLTVERVVEVQQAPDRLNKLLQILSGFYIDSNKDYELCDGCPFLMDCVANGDKPYTEQCMVETQDPPKTVIHLKEQPRLDQMAELVNSITQEPVNKVIIWAMYTEEINMVEERLETMGVGYVRVDGRTRDKVACEDKFREDPACQVYLSHISISEGLTLNSANYVIYYGLTYDLKDYVQSMKRNHRIGQERPVTVYHLITPGSIQRYILDALGRKQDIADTMTDAIRCGTCEFAKQCAENNVAPFDEDCIYSPTKSRVITRPALL